jgi:hypothetical protein
MIAEAERQNRDFTTEGTEDTEKREKGVITDVRAGSAWLNQLLEALFALLVDQIRD